ncbi:PucR family transcriptional regulator [Ureibacillus acetophenoni]|uniref:CdaR family transcriptional regulator n=1 Tax=Ureibacillus acetophenoni TaxID=614649 RepID=A0A285ULF2_9BACL|nr:PucR family transcriptional regulator [Ureibacillus acetophenoni]SOC42517.1 CdaR family transcriptional regulator [Ureibacillus acetophenoni]
MEFSVKDLLSLSSLKNAIVLSGKQYLHKIVKGSTIMEAPDITDWLNGGELILTSLYPILSFNEKEQREFIAKLADKDISALIIKTHRFVKEIPQSIIDEAEKCKLPIIQIPKEVPYVDIMYPVMEEILDIQVKRLQYYKEIHDQFTALSLANESEEKIIKTLENLIGNPVALFDRNFLCLATTSPHLTNFEIVEKNFHVDKSELMKFPHYRQVVKYYEEKEKIGHQIVVQIETINHIKTYLLIGEMNKPLHELDFIAVENAATSLSLELVKKFAIAEVDKRFKNDLLEQLIEGKLPTNLLYHDANLIGWDIEGAFAVVLFKIRKNKDQNLTKKTKRRISNGNEETLLDESIHRYLPNAITGNKSGLKVVLWRVNVESEQWLNKIKDRVTSIIDWVKKQDNEIMIQVGIGTLAEDVNNISDSYIKARDALEYGEVLNGKESITSYSELGVFRMLGQFTNSEDLKSFIPPSLQTLLEYQQANKSDLLTTLKVFLQCNQNATKASQLLFIHHKTAVYRIERIKEITGMNFEDAEEMLLVQIGLKIIELLEREKINKY